MSYPHNAYDMESPSRIEGFVRRPYDMAQASQQAPDRRLYPRSHMPPAQPPPSRPPGQPPPPIPTSSPSKSPRPRAPLAHEGKGAHVISRPTQAPHWPLPPGPPLAVRSRDQQSSPTPGQRQRAPPRPARPSQVPSLVDQTCPQGPTPIFFAPQDDASEINGTAYDSPLASATESYRLTTSSVGTIPEFPIPAKHAAPRSVQALASEASMWRSPNLGPPPSSRRGTFYSPYSYVHPIPEESPGSAVYVSCASSTAMPNAVPEAWDGGSPVSNRTFNTDAFYDDSITEWSRDSMFEDFGDESKLVRSASIGKKAKAALVDTKPSVPVLPLEMRNGMRPGPAPVQAAVDGGTGYVEVSTKSSNALPPAKPLPLPLAGSGGNGIENQKDISSASTPHPSRRLSAIKRPPRLDIDAVRAAEARGSMTSLPDLIKRATRLASMIDKGARPASRLDNLTDFLNDKRGVVGHADSSSNDKHQSGLSDMLAAFPPPGFPTRGGQGRDSWFQTTSWPFPPSKRSEVPRKEAQGPQKPAKDDRAARKPRRCCGMSPGVFVIVVIIILCIIVAAVVVPIQFLVLKNWGNHGPPPLSNSEAQCKADLVCKNGGTNVLSQGVCSCICTNGFTGSDCSTGGSEGCTTTNLVSTDGSFTVNDVTLGKAVPRLIADARTNFSIPLSGTTLLAKINSGGFSCREQNALVTFVGNPSASGQMKSTRLSVDDEMSKGVQMKAVPSSPTVTAAPDLATRFVGSNLSRRQANGEEEPSSLVVDVSTAVEDSAPRATATASPSDKGGSDVSSEFNLTEEVLDFARVAVLYVLQEQSFDDAETAQNDLQSFFDRAGGGITERQAYNLTIGGGSTINLVSSRLDLGAGVVGKSLTRRGVRSMRYSRL